MKRSRGRGQNEAEIRPRGTDRKVISAKMRQKWDQGVLTVMSFLPQLGISQPSEMCHKKLISWFERRRGRSRTRSQGFNAHLKGCHIGGGLRLGCCWPGYSSLATLQSRPAVEPGGHCPVPVKTRHKNRSMWTWAHLALLNEKLLCWVI